MTEHYKIPFYAKGSLILIGIFVLFGMLYIGRDIIVPIVVSVILAILLSPVVKFLVKFKINRVLAILIVFAVFTGFLLFLIVLLTGRFSEMVNSLPELTDKFYLALDKSIVWISENTGLSSKSLNGYLVDTETEVMKDSSTMIGTTLITIGNGLVIFFLIPVYIFMLLFYQPLLLDFIRKLFHKNNHEEVNAVLNSVKSIIQHYLIGLLIELVIVAVLVSIGLMILGIKYAIVLGVVCSLLNLIPYIGAILGAVLPMMVALLTNSSILDVWLVLILFVVIQFIDNNLIVPKVVASKVKINALVSIIAVLSGAALWGIPGMFLAIPLVAIIKVVFDHIDELKPWGFLLGDTMPPVLKFKSISKKWNN